MGLLNEVICYVQRFFVPTDPETGVPVLAKLLAKYPPID
jgi:hypothetical protein